VVERGGRRCEAAELEFVGGRRPPPAIEEVGGGGGGGGGSTPPPRGIEGPTSINFNG
jgi:hypothetical protein